MTRTGRGRQIARRALPWLAAWVGAQLAVRIAGRLVARRLDEGDESATSIRRVLTMSGLELRPTNPGLRRIHVDLGMAGGEIDLTGIGDTRGVDLTVHAGMGGLAVRVPPDWRVWWRFRGVGGIGTDGGLTRTHDEHEADLRVRAVAVMGGIGLEAAARA
jgi:hypothetical protein